MDPQLPTPYYTNGYYLKHLIGKGSFGAVYLGRHKDTNEEVAVKLESIDTKHKQLLREAKIYDLLGSIPFIPKIHYYGKDPHHNIMVMDLMGPSLSSLFEYCNHSFSLKTVLMLANKMLNIIQQVHEKGFLHRDLKPDNFVMGLRNKANTLYIIDFGLSKSYILPETNQHIPYIEGKSLTGTARYAALASHEGKESSRRDDLESIGYILVYFLKGRLPWQGLKPARDNSKRKDRGKNKINKYNAIYEKKKQLPIEELCSGLPQEFSEYLRSIRQLSFSEQPNYSSYRRLFRNLFSNLNYTYDKYDWSII
jgi:casein kinase 1